MKCSKNKNRGCTGVAPGGGVQLARQ